MKNFNLEHADGIVEMNPSELMETNGGGLWSLLGEWFAVGSAILAKQCYDNHGVNYNTMCLSQ
ncbi:hypothetical protein CLV53_1561 [Sediminibacterium magnilacihabitans]|jgi:hypothetical protein|nr:hypothetical protein CLV53_1561 [Sediminibacterium magnilacihabitans]